MPLARICLVAALLVAALAGCVMRVDKRMWNQQVSETTANLSHRFLASSPDGQSFSDFMYTAAADTVLLVLDNDYGLNLYFEKDGAEVHSRAYTFEDGLSIRPDGALELWSKGACGSGDSPVIGCERSGVVLFVNQDGDLILSRFASAGGLLGGLVPIGSQTQSFARFRAKK